MNLKQLRERIQNISDLKATNLNHTNEIDQLINDAYMQLWRVRNWNFAKKTIYLPVIPDIYQGVAAPYIQTATIQDFSRQVTFSASVDILRNEIYMGQYIELEGREYKILKVVSDTEIRLEEPFRGTSSASYADWKLKVKTYALPQDLIAIASLSHRDAPIVGSVRKHIKGLSAYQDEIYTLEEDRTCDFADHYIPTPPKNIPAAQKTGYVGTFSATNGNIPNNYYYEFCWCFKYQEMYGALSEPIKAQAAKAEGSSYNTIRLRTLAHDNTTIVAPAYDPIFDRYPNPWEGLEKVFWVNVNYDHVTGTRLGLPKWVSVTRYVGTPTQYDHLPIILPDQTADIDILWTQQLDPGNTVYIEIDGQHQLIRPYPRIDGYDARYAKGFILIDLETTIVKPEQWFRQLELRYNYKPPELTYVTDSPELPYEMHELIVYKALEDYYNKKANTVLSRTYALKYEAGLRSAVEKHVDHPAVISQRVSGFDKTFFPVWTGRVTKV